MEYLDFDLEIGQAVGREYPLAVLHSPAGEARASASFPLDDLALENHLLKLEKALLRGGGAQQRKVLTPEEQAARNLGAWLFEFLLPAEIRSRFDVSLERARVQNKGLRLRLHIQDARLAALPWEFIFDPRQADYLCLSQETPLVRYQELPQTLRPLAVQPPLHILALAPAPLDLAPLDIERERQRLEKALANLQQRGLVQITWLSGQTWRDLQRALRTGTYHILHFVGHGMFDVRRGEGQLAFSNQQGQSEMLDASGLARLLGDHRSLRLAVLNTCDSDLTSGKDLFSSTAAILVQRGLPAVLAMQYAISDRAAIELSQAFYEALADGLPVDAAVVEARKTLSVELRQSLEWGVPVLHLRALDGVLFQFVPQPTPVEQVLPSELPKLYARVQAARTSGDWSQALKLLQQIQILDNNYLDCSRLLTEAQTQEALSERYQQALAAEERQDWAQAQEILEAVLAESPGYGDAQERLQQVNNQRRLIAKEARRQDQENKQKFAEHTPSQVGTSLPIQTREQPAPLMVSIWPPAILIVLALFVGSLELLNSLLLPSLLERHALIPATMGSISFAVFLGSLAGWFLGGWLATRLPIRRLLALCLGIIAMVLILAPLVPTFFLFTPAWFVYGLSAGALILILYLLVLHTTSPSHGSLLLIACCQMVGPLISQILKNIWAASLNTNMIFWSMAALALIILFLILKSNLAQPAASSDASRLAPGRLFLPLLLILSFAGLQSINSYWQSFRIHDFGMDATQVFTIVSLATLGIAAAYLGCIPLLYRHPPLRIMLVALGVTAGIMGLLFISDNQSITDIGLVIITILLGPLFILALLALPVAKRLDWVNLSLFFLARGIGNLGIGLAASSFAGKPSWLLFFTLVFVALGTGWAWGRQGSS